MKDYSKNLFDFIEALFNKNEYSQIDRMTKRKHSFMVNRFMSKLYPTVASNLNYNGIQSELVCDFWHYQVGLKMPYFKFKPYLSHNKGLLNTQFESKPKLSKDDIELLMRKYGFGMNDILSMVDNDYASISALLEKNKKKTKMDAK